MFKKGVRKWTRLKSKVVSPWRVQFWSLFGPFIVANLLKRLFQVETDTPSSSWFLPPPFSVAVWLSVFWLVVSPVCCCVTWFGMVGPELEPWTGLHCSELHWRCPGELSAFQSRAPASSKVCKHGSYGVDAML